MQIDNHHHHHQAAKPRSIGEQRITFGRLAKPPSPKMNSRNSRISSLNKTSRSSLSSETENLSSSSSRDGLLFVLFDHEGATINGSMLKRQQANKEIVKRAIAPPKRKQFSLRWKFFRPTPSRLSAMSMA